MSIKQRIQSSLGDLYFWGTEARNFLYDLKYADQLQLPCQVISVGNLTFGGTGKTPLISVLIEKGLEKKKKICVVSRNYKADSQGIHRIDIHRKRGAQFYGDEAWMLAQRHPEVAVYTGPQKWKTADQAFTEIQPDLILVDDGFQHRALGRTTDIVILDATEEIENYQAPPLGRMREKFRSLKRAQFVVLSKVNFATEAQLNFVRAQIPEGLEVAEVEYHPVIEEGISDSVILVSGLARPETFEKSVLQAGANSFLKCFHFQDHFNYRKEDLEPAEELCISSGRPLITTEKDWVKIRDVSFRPHLYRVLRLKLKFRSGEVPFYALV
jgi:tetraacyldisaccharide 4'-kinase